MAWIWRVFVSMRVERDIMQTRREELRQVGGHNRELTPFCTVRFTRYRKGIAAANHTIESLEYLL
jgi:hypothetical protein